MESSHAQLWLFEQYIVYIHASQGEQRCARSQNVKYLEHKYPMPFVNQKKYLADQLA